jgi:hypothetical protein
VAQAFRHDDREAAQAALTLADELEDPGLRSEALGALQSALQETGAFMEAVAVADARALLLPSIADPDHVADTYFQAADLHANVGRLGEARPLVQRLEETVAGLTPHHRVHGLAMRLRMEAAVGDWATVRALTPRLEDWVEANLVTPCPFNVGLLILAAAAARHGDDAEADLRLVAKAESIGMVGYGQFHASRWLRLALARGDLGEAWRIIDAVEAPYLTPGNWELWAALFDGLAALGDRDRIEREAPGWIRPDAYVAPFAAKALGVVRKDADLMADAVARFEAMGMDWFAAETRRMAAVD